MTTAIACWLLCLPRTFKFVSQTGVPSTVSILAAVLIVIISLGVAGAPKNAPPLIAMWRDAKPKQVAAD